MLVNVHCVTFRQLAVLRRFYEFNFRRITASVRSEDLAGPHCEDDVMRSEVILTLNTLVIGSGMQLRLVWWTDTVGWEK